LSHTFRSEGLGIKKVEIFGDTSRIRPVNFRASGTPTNSYDWQECKTWGSEQTETFTNDDSTTGTTSPFQNCTEFYTDRSTTLYLSSSSGAVSCRTTATAIDCHGASPSVLASEVSWTINVIDDSQPDDGGSLMLMVTHSNDRVDTVQYQIEDNDRVWSFGPQPPGPCPMLHGLTGTRNGEGTCVYGTP